MMTSIRESDLSKLHHLTRELENEISVKKVIRYAERVENKFEGIVVTNSRSASSSSSSRYSSDYSSSPDSIASSMQVDESNQDSSKAQNVILWC